VTLYKRWNSRFAADPPLDRDSTLDLYDGWGRLATEAEGVTYRTVDANRVAGLWALPPDGRTDAAIIWAHGGGYIAGSPDSHRKLAGHVAKQSGIPVLLFAYRLVPEHPFPESQLEDARTVWDWVMGQGIPAQRIGLAGDSAGGGLATLFTLRLRDAAEALPGAVAVLSPMLDMTGESESLAAKAGVDLLSSPMGMKGLADLVLGGRYSAADPAVNPLKADARDLPPYFLSVGGDEGLLDDSVVFAARVREAGGEAEVEVVPGMQHVFQFMAGNAPEADESIVRIGDFLRSHLLEQR